MKVEPSETGGEICPKIDIFRYFLSALRFKHSKF